MEKSWSNLDEYSLLQIFSYLKPHELIRSEQVCKYWYFVANDDWLWKRLFCARFQLPFDKAGVVTLPPFAKTWKSEIKRLVFQIPKKYTELKNPHCEEVINVCFSSDGNYFLTIGRDSQVVLWNGKNGTLLDSIDLTQYGWQSAVHCEFNPECSMALVSGMKMGDISGRTKGEIMVFTFKSNKLKICAKLTNRPYDAFGCWYGNKYIITSEFKWLAHNVSTSMLLMNKVSFALEKNYNDHTLAGIRTLFRFYNSAGNALRYFCVANVAKDLGQADPECSTGIKLLESLDALLSAQLMIQENQAIVNLSTEVIATFDSILDVDNNYIRLMPDEKFEFDTPDDCSSAPFTFDPIYHKTRKIAFDAGLEDNEWIYDDDNLDFYEEDEVEWEYWDNAQEQANKPDLLKIDEGHEVINEDDKLLIMASGTQSCIPHMIAIKRMSRIRFRKDMDFSKSLAQRETERRSKRRMAERRSRLDQQQPVENNITNWHDYKAVSHKFDGLDYLIEMHGRIMGMALSPCHRYLYINVRPWPRNYKDASNQSSTPVGSLMDRHVLDLGRMSFVSTQLHTHQFALVASDNGRHAPICVSKHLVASGHEFENAAAIWDRHHGIEINKFQNSGSGGNAAINAIAINPQDESIAVTVADDMTIGFWTSAVGL